MKCQRVIARSKVYVKFKRYLCQNHSRTKMVNSTFCKLLNFFSIFTNVFKEIKFKHKFPPLIKYSIYIYICFYTLHAFWISTLPNAPRLFAFQYSLLKKRTISNTKVKKKSVIDHLPLLFDLDSMWFLNGSINIVSVAQVCAPLLIYSYRARHRCRYTKKRQRKRKKNRKHRGEQNVGKRKKVEDGASLSGRERMAIARRAWSRVETILYGFVVWNTSPSADLKSVSGHTAGTSCDWQFYSRDRPAAIVLPEAIVQLLGYVIVAQRILEWQVKKIARFRDSCEAILVTGTKHVAAFSINVDRYVLGQFVHVLFPAAFCHAVAHEPDYRLRLASNRLRQRRVHIVGDRSVTCANGSLLWWHHRWL